MNDGDAQALLREVRLIRISLVAGVVVYAVSFLAKLVNLHF